MALQALGAPQMGSAGNTHLPMAVTDEAAQSTGMRGKSQKREKMGEKLKFKKSHGGGSESQGRWGKWVRSSV